MKHLQSNLQFIDLTLPTPKENLALDEALLDLCEENKTGEVLRFWEPDQYFVVVGYSGKINSEVYVSACEQQKVPILRRPSGGGTVLQGPGCLNYSLILKINGSRPLANLTQTNASILKEHSLALEPLLAAPIQIQGTSDLAVGELKFSGNAQRRKRHALLFHGTFLTHFNLKQMEVFLPVPGKQPLYRRHRAHQSFLTNVDLPPARIKEAIQKQWNASEPFKGEIKKSVERLVKERYGQRAWNYKFE